MFRTVDSQVYGQHINVALITIVIILNHGIQTVRLILITGWYSVRHYGLIVTVYSLYVMFQIRVQFVRYKAVA